MTPQDYLVAQARNNAWANHRLLQACAALTQDAVEAPRIGFFPSILATLNHILVVDWYYVDALEGGSLGPDAWRDEVPCKTVADLSAAQSAVDWRLLQICEVLDEVALPHAVRLIRPDGVKVERTDRVLLHLFEHQVHHRGQVHAMLSDTGVAPPQLDEFFLNQDTALRREDFTALGWREEAVWAAWRPPGHT